MTPSQVYLALKAREAKRRLKRIQLKLALSARDRASAFVLTQIQSDL